MSQPGGGNSETTILLTLILGMAGYGLWQNVSARAARVQADHRTEGFSGARWTQEPKTALGQLFAALDAGRWQEWARRRTGKNRDLPRQEVALHYLTDRAVSISNASAGYWPYFLAGSLICILSLYVFIRRAPGYFTTEAAYLWGGAAFAVAGAGLVVSIPSRTPATWGYMGLGAGSIQTLAGILVSLWGTSAGTDTSKKLKYGPPFALPKTLFGVTAKKEDGVLVGKADKAILPDHTGWTATQSGDVVIPYELLSRGITILGEKGSGKTRLLMNFHDAIREQFDDVPMLIHDPKGEWYRTYYDKDKDLIFAPHFEGSSHWSIWDDFKTIPKLCHELLATAVYAHDIKDDTFWTENALEILGDVAKMPTIQKAVAQLDILKNKNQTNKTWLSIFQAAQLGLRDIIKVQLPPAQKPGESKPTPMSIDDYLKWKGRIFLLNDPSCASEQKGAFSLFLSAFLLRALSQPDMDAGKLRAVAIVDEALTFHLPPEVDLRISTLCRSKGISSIAGAQRLPARHLHERGEWETAEFMFAMKVINQPTQSSLARRAGQMHYDQARHGRSFSEGRISTSENDQAERIDAIPPEHFGRLATRQFVLFHDGGLVSGSAAAIDHKQDDKMEMPKYDPREDVRDLMSGKPSALAEGKQNPPAAPAVSVKTA